MKYKICIIIFLSILNIVLALEVADKIYILNQPINNLQAQIDPVRIDNKPPAERNKTIHYTLDANWSQPYSRQGDRNTRYSCISTTPVFKPHYIKWQGKQYIPYDKLKAVAEAVLKRMPHIKYHDDILQLIVETSIAESQGGYFISSKGGDYGIFQIRINTAQSLLDWLKDNHKDIYLAIDKFRDPKLSLADNLERNIPFGVAVCISEYWRKAGPEMHKYITSLDDRAKLWKSVYNTRFGKGTVDAYIKRVSDYAS